ncbi:MAG: hypothetical protein ACI9R3_002019, partial [Verrucomicrobiales bacterium]
HLERSEAVIDQCTFRGSRLRYIHSVSSSATISNCRFPDMFLPGEEPQALKLDNVSEHIKGTGAFPSGGHFIIRGNTFGSNAGHNDVIDVDSGQRSTESRQILQVLNNVFTGARDEQLDLGGDVYIDGNFFTNVFKDDQTSDRGYANSISTGDTGTDTNIVVTRNVFWDVDHAINLKRNAATVFENNTVVDVHDDFVDTFGFTNIGSAINLYVDEPGGTAARGAYAGSNIFYRVPRIFGNADLPEATTSVLTADYNSLNAQSATAQIGEREETAIDLGTANAIITNPAFVDEAKGDFRLKATSPARGAGALGRDAGAFVGSGIFVQGEPNAVTDASNALLTVGGPGFFSYQFRINEGAWSEELPIGDVLGFDQTNPDNRTAEIALTDLPNGTFQVAVRGRNFAGEWQVDPTLSRIWEVRALTNFESIRLSEVLASNRSAVEISGIFPDLIELENISSAPVDIGGMGLGDQPDVPAEFPFPAGTVIPANSYLTISAGTALGDALLATDFGLSGSGDAVALFAADGTLIDSISFGIQAADWSISRFYEEWKVGIPSLGAANIQTPTESPEILVINEFLATSSDRFEEDYIELYNPSRHPVDLTGLRLTDDTAYRPEKFTFSPLSFIAPEGFLTLDQSALDFSFARDSEEVALLDRDGFPIDGISIINAVGDGAYGRVPDGAPELQLLAIASPGQSNIAPISAHVDLLANLRITEILFSPANGTPHEFVELQNIGDTQLNLEGVRFTDGISFTFGAETLDPGEFIVVAQDTNAFAGRYGVGVRVVGNFSGRLDNSGETLELSLPAPAAAPIQRFRYEADWFSATANGRSLEFAAEPGGRTALWNERTSWLASTNPLGSPGKTGAPVVTNIAAQVIVEDTFTLAINVRNDVTSYRSSGLPAGLTMDRTTGVISGQPMEAGVFDVTITANSANGQRSGKLSLYVSAYGPFQELAWATLEERYTLSDAPIALILQAVDASGRTVESFTEQVNVTATQSGLPRALVVVTEIVDSAAIDAVELINVSGRPLPTAGWQVVVNDPANGVTGVAPVAQTFPEVLEAESIMIFDDVPDSGIYFGADLPWDSDQGWIMITDGSGTVIDFVPWGYSGETLADLQISVDGLTYQPGLLWKSTGLSALDEASAWHRTGDRNRFQPSQWTRAPSSLGTAHQNLALPFAGTVPLELPFAGNALLPAGVWMEALSPTAPIYGVQLSASTLDLTTAARSFSIVANTVPERSTIAPIFVVEGQPFQLTGRPAIDDSTIVRATEGLPLGLVLNPASGSISGHAPATGTYTFQLISKNLAGSQSIAVQLTTLRDSDGDGAPDTWEESNGLNSQVADADADIDSDGASNLNEYLAGTDPRDTGSVFRISNFTYSRESGQIDIEWRCVVGRTYAIETSDDLQDWTIVPGSEITANEAKIAHRFSQQGNNETHYRVRLLP